MSGLGRLSLKARALKLLAQREHSRIELRRKLMPHAVAACEATSTDATPETPGPCLDKLLDWLEARRYLSESRFIESRVNARAARFGQRRIQLELAQHGLALDSETASELKSTELQRARDLWQRRFGDLPADVGARAKQARFLAGRGFSGDTIRKVLKGSDED